MNAPAHLLQNIDAGFPAVQVRAATPPPLVVVVADVRSGVHPPRGVAVVAGVVHA